MTARISIPHGTIKTRFCLYLICLLRKISIPHGTIKTKESLLNIMRVIDFNSTWYD